MITVEKIAAIIKTHMPSDLDDQPLWITDLEQGKKALSLYAGARYVYLDVVQQWDGTTPHTQIRVIFHGAEPPIWTTKKVGCTKAWVIATEDQARQVGEWLYADRDRDTLEQEIKDHSTDVHQYAKGCLETGIEPDRDHVYEQVVDECHSH